MSYSERDLYKAAASLQSDEDENPEYDRALVEMIARLTAEDVEDIVETLKQFGVKDELT